MSLMNPDSPAEFTASEILSPQTWVARDKRAPLGLDITCTKIAVDFQNLTRPQLETTLRDNLELLRDAAGCDAAFVAMLKEPSW